MPKRTNSTKRKKQLEAHSLKQLYEARRNGRVSIFGTALGAYSAFFQWVLQCITWKTLLYNLTHLSIKKLYQLPHISDGYYLVFIGWIMWIWWVLCLAIIPLGICLLMLIAFPLIGKYIVFSLPYPILALYSVLIEFPASVLNRDLGKRNPRKYRKQREWGNNDFKILNMREPVFWWTFIVVGLANTIIIGVFYEGWCALVAFGYVMLAAEIEYPKLKKEN